MTHQATASWKSVLPPSAKKKSFQNKIKVAVLPNIIQSLNVETENETQRVKQAIQDEGQNTPDKSSELLVSLTEEFPRVVYP